MISSQAVKDWRLSKYNHVVDRSDGKVAYNARRGSFVRLNKETEKVLNGSMPISSLDDDLLDDLDDLGFIVSSDELALIADELLEMRLARTSAYSHIVITPTLSCNFRCSYCDQNGMRRTPRMTDHTFGSVIELIRAGLDRLEGQLRITWYGGEPLLELERIRELHSSIGGSLIARLDQHIITNGTLLNSENCQKLIDFGISTAQISFDALHYKNGVDRGVIQPNGTPSVITLNIMEAVRRGIKVSIRLNIDSKTAAILGEIEAALERFDLKKHSYVSRVEDNIEARSEFNQKSGHHCGLLPGASNSVSRRSFAQIEKDRIFTRSHIRTLVGMLTPKRDVCGATRSSMLVVAPEGGISRCWNSVGVSAEEIGNVCDQDIASKIDSDLRNSVWNEYLPTRFDSCRTCPALPLCMGGCSHARVMLDRNEPPCTPVKYYLSDLVKYVGNRLEI